MRRLYDAPAVVFNSREEDVTGQAAPKPVHVTLDFERVLYVGDDPDDPDRCIVEMMGEAVTLCQTRDVFAANWSDYREHADALNRLRN